MDLLDKLKAQGWHLKEDALKKLPESDVGKIIKAALDIDFREIASGALPIEIPRKDESMPGRIVLQVSKIRNIAAPKANEDSKAAPRFLQLELTDGNTSVQALEMEHISALSLNIPPGTKIFFNCDRISLMQGIIALKPKDIQVLGGKVPALVEKWEISRTLLKYARGGRMMGGSSGPPPWIPFGQKIQQTIDDKNFKSLNEEAKENNEFDAMRNEAIAEAAKKGAKKTFGGSNIQLVDHNVKKILEKGYTEEEANNALRASRNNLERALYNLKRRKDFESKDDYRDRSGRRGPKDSLRKGKDDLAVSSKPAEKVSLFDFLTDKLPANAEENETTSSQPPSQKYDYPKSERGPRSSNDSSAKPYYNQNSHGSNIPSGQSSSQSTNQNSKPKYEKYEKFEKFENNLSSSFAANRHTSHSGDDRNSRSHRGGGSGRGGYQGRQHEDRNAYNSRNQRSSHERSTYQSSGDQRSTSYDNRRGNSDYSHQQQQQPSHQQSRNGYDKKSTGPTASRYPPKENTGNYQRGNNRQTSYNNQSTNDNSNNMQKLVEDTSKLKIDKTRNGPSPRHNPFAGPPLNVSHGKPHYQGQHIHPSHHQTQQQQQHHPPMQKQQQPQQVVTHQPPQQPCPPPTVIQHHAIPAHGSFAQLPNGYTYDPSKIIGFQSKETNEFALTLLKSQGVPQQHDKQLAHPQFITASPMQIAPQPFAPTATFVMSQPPPHGAAPVPFGIGEWMWKVGDRCLAKYWDDGRYYEAEITGISDKTCVVLYIAYGNHEEVLKSDCLPITDAQHRPINFTTVSQSAQIMPPPQPTVVSRGVPNRYRGERQMYVPPPKREN